MRGLIGLKGVWALMGRAPMSDFPTFYGEQTSAFKSSLAAVGGSVWLIMLTARSIIMMQSRRADGDNIEKAVSQELPLLNIGITALFYLLVFTVTAFLLTTLFHKKEAFGRWATLRHWMVFYALIPTALILTLAGSGLLPAILATGVLFTVFIGLLFADIRLAFKAGTLDIVGAIFAACIVHAAGLVIIFTATLQSLP